MTLPCFSVLGWPWWIVYMRVFCYSKIKTKSSRFGVCKEISVMTEKAFSSNYVTNLRCQTACVSKSAPIHSLSFISISSIFSIRIHYIPTKSLYYLNRLELDTDKMGGEGQYQFAKECSKRKTRRADCYRPWSRSGSCLVTNALYTYDSTCSPNRLAFPLRGPYGRCALVHHGVLCE